jgi:hypothetical protein
MSDLFAKAEELTGHVKEYINTKIEIAKLDIAEKGSRIISNMVAGIIVAILFVFVLVFASFAGAYALSEWIGNTYAGFLIVAGIYLLIGVVVWVTRTRILQIPIMNAIIRQLFSGDDPDKGGQKL